MKAADSFYEHIGIGRLLSPIHKKLDKKMFYEQGGLKKGEKETISKLIEKMELAYLLSLSTINIQPFISDEYHVEGVMFLTVQLREDPSDRQVATIDEAIHRALPHPVVLVFDWNGECQISTAMKRLNKVDRSGVVIEGIHRTGWFFPSEAKAEFEAFLQAVRLENVRFSSFLDFYKDIDRAVEAIKLSRVAGSYKIAGSEAEYEERQAALLQIEKLEQEAVKLKTAIRKESQFNKKVEMNVKIQQLLKQMESLKKQLDTQGE
ncbi:hypothetical protein BN1002_01323 [Bacillus sp. B-jedd]|nr:hypothetical protein BN1002_01323 [Bacillus sp. B-jedd]